MTRESALREAGSVLAEPLLAVVVDEEKAVDVNALLDFGVAEALVRARKERAWH